MNFVQMEHFAVMGIEVRTSNAREMTPDGQIGRQWERFAKEGLAARIPQRADQNLVAVYSGYASDEHGEYDYLLGAKVSGIAEIPAGMTVRHVPTGRYAVFTSERGPVTKVVPEAWKRIWDEPRTATYARSYKVDFELYGARAANPADSQVEIYIGVGVKDQ
jgi:predicted transcriptional regulator YdeE